MDTCFPLLKLKHHCEQQERERSTRGREEPETERAPTAGPRRRGEGEGRAGGGRPRRTVRQRALPGCPARQGGPALAACTPGSATRAEGGTPSSQSSPFLCSFLSVSLLLKGDYVLAGKTSHFCAEQAPCRGGRAGRAPRRCGFCPHQLCIGPGHAACVLRGFHLKKTRCLGFFCLFFKDSFK